MNKLNLNFKMDGWIAKDASGVVYFYHSKPKRLTSVWHCDTNYLKLSEVFGDLIPTIDWKDSLFQIVDGKIIKYIEKPDFQVDDLILVSVDNENWRLRYFAGWTKFGILAWNNGSTSITADEKTSWVYWKKYENSCHPYNLNEIK